MKRYAVLIGMALCVCASASTPNDYAQRWPVVGALPDNAYAIELDESVYRAVRREDLSDLSVFNAAGEELPFGPAPAMYGPAPAVWLPAKAFQLPVQAGQSESQINMQIKQGVQGGMHLDAEVSKHAGKPAAFEWIIEARHSGQANEALQLMVAEQSADFTAQVAVEGSDDLQQWRHLGSAMLVSLQQDGRRLQKLTVDLADGDADYLRVRFPDPPPGLVVNGFRLKQRAVGTLGTPGLRWLQAEWLSRDGSANIYRVPAWVPHEQLDIDLQGVNAIAHFSVSSRQREDHAWRYQADLTAFHLRAGGLAMDSEALALPPGRTRHWCIESDTELKDPPVLKIGYRPERFLLLTHGGPPYVLAAGSLTVKRNYTPLQALAAEVGRKQGSAWRPGIAQLGAPMRSATDAAADGRMPGNGKQALLWLTLILGAGAIMFMVYRLLRKPAE